MHERGKRVKGKGKGESRFFGLTLYPLPFPLFPALVLVVSFAWLGETKPISGVVLEDGFNAVGSFGGFGNKLHALALQLFISAAAVVGVEYSRTEHTFRHDRS